MRQADFTGLRKDSAAWRVDMDDLRKRHDIPKTADATVSAWVIKAPWAHPIWHSYVFVLLHLRDTQDLPQKITFYLEGATHEIWLMALDPKGDLEALVNDLDFKKCQRLLPNNFAAQIIEIEDKFAVERCERAIQMICDGKLSPDTDFTHMWIRLFGSNMMKGRDW